MQRALAVLFVFLLSACNGAHTRPPRSPLAQLSYDADPPTLYVGDREAHVSPYNKAYTTLLSGEARTIAERGHRDRLTGALLGLVTTASAIAALVLVIKYEGDAFDMDEPEGKATVGLVIGSGLVGSIGALFARRGRGRLHEAVNVYNAEVLARDFVPRLEPQPAVAPGGESMPVPAPVVPAPAQPAPAPPAAVVPGPVVPVPAPTPAGAVAPPAPVVPPPATPPAPPAPR
jgi:hypothetical protein